MTTMVLDGLSPRSRSTDPVTSVDAGRAADLNGSQAAVLDFMRVRDRDSGYTHWQLEGYLDDLYSPSRIRSAVSELEALGLVEATGDTRPTRFGRQARVYRAVPTG